MRGFDVVHGVLDAVETWLAEPVVFDGFPEWLEPDRRHLQQPQEGRLHQRVYTTLRH